MKASELITKLERLLTENTVYVNGGFGTTLRGSQLDRYTSKGYNKDNAEKIKQAASQPPCYGFDCVGLVKGLLWGFSFKSESTYGGATYKGNGIDDVGVLSFAQKYCTAITDAKDGADYPAGCFVYMADGSHCGYYVGDGKVIHSSRYGLGKVQYGKLSDFDKIAKIQCIEYDAPSKKSFVCPCCGAKFVEV